MTVDFSLWLMVLIILSFVILAIDKIFFKADRVRKQADNAESLNAGSAESRAAASKHSEPVLVEYARSFYPVLCLVLVVRSFLFEPFRIPSDSMMPTLLAGDFIFVSKFSYDLRMPVFNTKLLETGDPLRGDVIVFRLPADPRINYIKRLIGLPGDHVVVTNDVVYINGKKMDVVMGIQMPGSVKRIWAASNTRSCSWIMHLPRISTGWCRLASTCSWVIIEITVRMADLFRWVMCRRKTWSGKPS